MNRLVKHLFFWCILLLWINPIFNAKGLHSWDFFLFNLVRLPLITTSTYVLIYFLLPKYLFEQQDFKKFGVAFVCLFLATNLLDRCLIGTSLVDYIMSDTGLTYTFFNGIPLFRNAFLLLAIMSLASIHPILEQQKRLVLQLSDKEGTILDVALSSLPSKKEEEYFYLKSGNTRHQLRWSSILYLEKEENYVVYHTVNKKYLERSTLKKAAEKAPANFSRVHKSFVVSIENIEQVKKNHLHIGGRQIPIGRTYRKAFLDSL